MSGSRPRSAARLAPLRPANAPPRAERRPTRREVHGVTLEDEYAWLRDARWQEVLRDPAMLSPDIRAYLEAENAHARATLAPAKALSRRLFREMKARIKQDDASVPTPDGAFDYYDRFRVGGQHPIVCRRRRDEPESEAMLLDGDALARGKPFFDFGAAEHAPCHRFLAWSCDDKGSEFYTLRVRDLETGEDLSETIADTDGGAVWSDDSRFLYTVRLDENHRPLTVIGRPRGGAAETERVLFHETDPTVFVDVDGVKPGGYAVISGAQSDSTEIRLIDFATPEAPPRLIFPRQPDVKYSLDVHPTLLGAPTLVILTNEGGAEDYKLVAAPVDRPERERWVEIAPHRPGVLILSVAVFRDFIVRMERENALPRLVVRQIATGAEHAIAFDEEAYSLGLLDGYEFDTDVVRFVYSSMTTPAETWDYDMRARTRTLRKRQEIPSGHDPSAYATRRVMATAPDGEGVPVSLLYARSTPLDGTAPLLLYGYGSYGSSMPAGFSSTRFSLVDRGFVYAIAHVRGGMEKGYRWYRNGKREHKLNTFRDFIAAGEHLIREGVARKDGVVAHGGSAGGMLMGAVANMRPDLFAGVIADVPFVDVINTMLDDTLPLTPPEWLEWGDPIRDPEAFRRMLGYSPYDNVAAQAYPAILAQAGLTDPRVTYWEPAKWAARLRALKIDDNPLLLLTNMKAGHGGASGRFERLRELADAYAFALHVGGGWKRRRVVRP